MIGCAANVIAIARHNCHHGCCCCCLQRYRFYLVGMYASKGDVASVYVGDVNVVTAVVVDAGITLPTVIPFGTLQTFSEFEHQKINFNCLNFS